MRGFLRRQASGKLGSPACRKLEPGHVRARFVYAFGGAGLLTVVTAFTGLVGVRLNSRVLLGLYSSLLVLMLLGQALVAIALFADDAWTKRLPPDTTGEAKKVIGACHSGRLVPKARLRMHLISAD